MIKKPSLLLKHLFFSTQTSVAASSSSSIQWRNQMKETQMVSQISCILLQRQNWPLFIQKLNLSSKLLTPHIFIQILRRTQTHPDISLNFFRWAESNVRGFKPDFTSRCQLIQILVSSGSLQPATPLLDSLIHESQSSSSASLLIDSFLHLHTHDHISLLTSFVLERYSNHGLLFQALQIFQTITRLSYPPSTTSCNALLDALQRNNEITLACCFCASFVRHGVSMDSFTWSLVARLLCRRGRLQTAVKMLYSGVSTPAIFDLVIDTYCKMGNVVAALHHLNEMQHVKNFTPGFWLYSSVLDGACKCGDFALVEVITRDMVVREMIPAFPCSDYNPLIQKLGELGRSYAAEMLFERALKEKSELQDASYGCMLTVLCEQGRVKEAMPIYQSIKEKDISLNHSSYHAFADAICKEEPSEEVDKLLKDVIDRGFIPHGSQFSKLIARHCKEGRWKEAEGLLNMILDKGMSPDSSSCSSLVEHYCANGQIDLAVALKDKIEKLGGDLTVAAYNTLLIVLFKERGTGEAMQVFEHMRRQNLLNSSSFSIMVIGLSHKREMRKAMKIHDDMLKRGLKPDRATYKRLITRFS